MEIVDRRLEVHGLPEEHEAKLWCIQEDPATRLEASGVSRMLEGHMQIQEPPMAAEFRPG